MRSEFVAKRVVAHSDGEHVRDAFQLPGSHRDVDPSIVAWNAGTCRQNVRRSGRPRRLARRDWIARASRSAATPPPQDVSTTCPDQSQLCA